MKGLGAAANKSLLLSENIWPKPRGGLEGELPNGLVFCCAGARPGARGHTSASARHRPPHLSDLVMHNTLMLIMHYTLILELP